MLRFSLNLKGHLDTIASRYVISLKQKFSTRYEGYSCHLVWIIETVVNPLKFIKVKGNC